MSEEILRGEALQGLKTHQGYKVLIDEIIYPMYQDALLILEEKEDVNARATIKVIKDIIAKIDDTINLGEQLAQEFREKLNTHTQGTP